MVKATTIFQWHLLLATLIATSPLRLGSEWPASIALTIAILGVMTTHALVRGGAVAIVVAAILVLLVAVGLSTVVWLLILAIRVVIVSRPLVVSTTASTLTTIATLTSVATATVGTIVSLVGGTTIVVALGVVIGTIHFVVSEILLFAISFFF